MFGSSGIRGVANKDLSVELAVSVGLAVGSMHESAVIGRDPRMASEMIELGLISGLIACGCDVTRLGLVSTPTLAHAARSYDCGVMVTASHNPAEYIGLKLWNPDGTSFNSRQQKDVELLISETRSHPAYTGNRARWDAIGRIASYDNAVYDHKEAVLRHFEEGANCRVVVDCGSGAGATITPYLLREMGCEVITLNAQLDGYFPARDPEPIERNLNLLMEAVRSFRADIGIAHDGDADRMMAVDRGGRYITGDEMLALFAVREAKKGAVYPIDTSRMVDDVLACTVHKTRIGDVYVAEEVKRLNADFGGESSGSWIFPHFSYCPDGIYAAAKIVSIAAHESISELIAQFPVYHILRGSFSCETGKDPMPAIARELRSFDGAQMSTLDGVRLDFDDGWFLVRKSGTEPKIRITAEAKDQETMQSLYDRARVVVQRHV
ncbi:MAG TPA: phosphoglucosamine mutase [Candidatus Acidoferrales bacterium]|nr:phosphoglucosamine mutase [Candidatus Acidoferrales bacterium]